MKKRIVTIALVVALLATCFAGTYAYLTDNEQATNEFTIGNIAIDLYETVSHTDAKGNNVTDPAADLGKGSNDATSYEYKKVMPGDTMQKLVTVENTGTNDAYIALVIKQDNYLNFNRKVDDYYEAGLEAANVQKDGAEWNTAMQQIIDDIFCGWDLDYTKEKYAVRYVMDKTPAGNVLGYGYANYSYNSEHGGYYYNYVGEYFTNGKWINEAPAGEPDFMTIGNLHDRVWIIYLQVPAGQSYTVDLTTKCPTYFDNNSIQAFNNMALDVKAFAIQTQGFTAKEAFAEVLKPGFGF